MCSFESDLSGFWLLSSTHTHTHTRARAVRERGKERVLVTKFNTHKARARAQ